MSATKTCPSCGAENDVIFTNCLFCKTSLPQVDLNSISNEDLILNAGEWVGKARQHDYVISKNDPNANEWTGKGVHRIKVNNADMVGNAERYLSLIQVRAISNTNLLPLYESLRRQLEENKTFAASNDPMSKIHKQTKFVFIIILVMFVLCVLAAILS
jgi:hypothetical protein